MISIGSSVIESIMYITTIITYFKHISYTHIYLVREESNTVVWYSSSRVHFTRFPLEKFEGGKEQVFVCKSIYAFINTICNKRRGKNQQKEGIKDKERV